MLRRRECGVCLRILGREILRGSVFVNRVAAEGAAQNHHGDKAAMPLICSLWERSKLNHNASLEGDVMPPSIIGEARTVPFVQSGK